MNFEEKIQTARAAEYKRGYAAGRKSLEPDWVSASLRQPDRFSDAAPVLAPPVTAFGVQAFHTGGKALPQAFQQA